MKTKIIPFDLETAKKIQAGEIEGKIKTRDGERVMRICCYDSTAKYCEDTQPILAQDIDECDYICAYYEDGSYMIHDEKDDRDLVIEVPDNEPQLKPFDKVLCRDDSDEVWKANLFSHKAHGLEYQYYVCGGGFYKQCIAYEGNEHLLGTTNKPENE